MFGKRLSEMGELLPKLQTTKKEPAWLGFIPKGGCYNYFQFTFHDDEYWAEYMLFPEGQLSSEEAFIQAASRLRLDVGRVKLNGEEYLKASLGGYADRAWSLGLEIVKRTCGVDENIKVEQSSQGV